MSEAEPIQFWFSIGSTYTYLSVMRLAAAEQEYGVAFDWQPFNVRAIITDIGNVPFQGKPPKLAYMWADLGRRAAMYGIPAHLPAPYPLPGLNLANRVAIVARDEGWCPAYVQTHYRRWFQQGQEPGAEPNLSGSLREIGQEPDRVLRLAQSDEIAQPYDAATTRARELGIFGSPSFATRGQLFWGDDRLEDAVSWHKHGRVIRPAWENLNA
jgi:2-hydroxychromene-2-carboxylate isomerase